VEDNQDLHLFPPPDKNERDGDGNERPRDGEKQVGVIAEHYVEHELILHQLRLSSVLQVRHPRAAFWPLM
jgi:hypothetical protein